MTVGHKPVFCLSRCVNQSQKCRRSWRQPQLLDGLTRLVSEASEYYHYCSRIYIIFSRNDNCLWFSTHGLARRRFHPTSLFFLEKPTSFIVSTIQNCPKSYLRRGWGAKPFKLAPIRYSYSFSFFAAIYYTSGSFCLSIPFRFSWQRGGDGVFTIFNYSITLGRNYGVQTVSLGIRHFFPLACPEISFVR